MSFILDALKKSDSERQRQSGPALFEVRRAIPRNGLPAWAIVLGVLLLVNIVALGWFVTRSRVPVASPAPIAAAAPIPSPVVAPAPPAGIPTPATTPLLSAAAAAQPAATVLPPQQASPPEPAVDETGNPADYEEALPERSRAAVSAPEGDFAPTVDKLPAAISNQLPQLHLDMLVYATRAADRFVLVNMQRLREGESTRDGARVEAITASGVVMSYRGTRFLLERD